MEPQACTIVRIIVVYERHSEEFSQEEFDLAPEEVDVVAPLIEAMRLVRPEEEDKTV